MRKAYFVNISNHNSKDWGDKQTCAAGLYGEIVDIPFPYINPRSNSEDIDRLVDYYFEKVMNYAPAAVMLQGEFVFTFRLVNRLKAVEINVLASSTERKVTEELMPDGTVRRSSFFEFIAFREY